MPMIVSLEGEEATGKTTFAYTAPLKIVGFSFDMGTERALFGSMAKLFNGLKVGTVPYRQGEAEQWRDYDITVYELPPPIQLDSTLVHGCIDLWDYFVGLYVAAVQDPLVRTLVVDTMTIARRVKADAHLEGLQHDALNPDGSLKPNEKLRRQLIQVEWGPANDATRNLYTTPKGLKKNLIATHHLTDERKDLPGKDGAIQQGVLTGRRILEGYSQTNRYVDVAIRMEKAGKAIIGTLVKCGYDIGQEGTPLNNPTWNSVVNLISMSLGGSLQLEERNLHEPADVNG
jgi:hypothetical protein